MLYWRYNPVKNYSYITFEVAYEQYSPKGNP